MFHPLMQQSVLKLRLLGVGGSVCEFGNQRYDGGGQYRSVREFYLDSGFNEYVALDVNTEKDAIIADLNEPVELGRQFDLVTNNGTSEHLWNQHQVFKNAHDLCCTGGIMLHCLPCSPWLNHGFYNYNPVLFRDLAHANGYSIALAGLGNRWGAFIEMGEWAYVEKRPRELEENVARILAHKRGEVFVVFGLCKTQAAPFRMPMQGKYQRDIESGEIKERYRAAG